MCMGGKCGKCGAACNAPEPKGKPGMAAKPSPDMAARMKAMAAMKKSKSKY